MMDYWRDDRSTIKPGLLRVKTKAGGLVMKTINEDRSALAMNEAHPLPSMFWGVALTLIGTFGIAAMMAWIPTLVGSAGFVPLLDKLVAPTTSTVDAEAHVPSGHANGDEHVRMKCTECGVVESLRKLRQGDGDIEGSADMPKDGLNDISGKPATHYEITVRMKDGSSRVFRDTSVANWRPGERVVFIEGAGHSND